MIMEKLLNDLNLIDESNELNHLVITNVKVKKTEPMWTIVINSEKYIDVNVLNEFLNATKNHFKKISNVDINFDILIDGELTDEIFKSYYDFAVNSFELSTSVKNIIVNRNIVFDKDIYEARLEIHNHYEYEIVKDKIVEIENSIKCLGLDINLVCKEIAVEVNNNDGLEKILLEAAREEKQKTSNVKEVKTVYKKDNLLYGKDIGRVNMKIVNLESSSRNFVIEGEVFEVTSFTTKASKVIVTIYLCDDTYSISGKLFLDSKDSSLSEILNLEGKYIKMAGHMNYDQYDKNDVIRITAISLEEKSKVLDNATRKRIELHTHTKMSAVDSVVEIKDLVEFCKNNQYRAVGVVDHNSVQAFPNLYNMTKNSDLKVIYGIEMSVVDDNLNLSFNNKNQKSVSFDDTFVVLDFETTGLNAYGGDRIFEFGAVKIKNGEIISEFGEIADPGIELSSKITEITKVTNAMIKGKRSEEDVLKDFKIWIEDLPIVAHNAKFDFGFLETAYARFNLGEVKNVVYDTLQISRILHPEWGRHGLGYLVKKYKVELENHHRALHDARATAFIFNEQLQEMKEVISDLNDINLLVNTEEIHKFAPVSHMTILVKNNVGLKNLFKLVSLASTKYFYKEPRIPRSELELHREGLLFGSSCVNGEVFRQAKQLNESDLVNLMRFYDYLEVQPPEVNNHLVQRGEFENLSDVMNIIKKIVKCGEKADKIVVATGDVHHLKRSDKKFREVIINNPVPGGGFHPLKHRDIVDIPSQHFRSTFEMLKDFEFLDEALAKKIVIDNPEKICDLIEEVQVIKDELYSPKFPNSEQITRDSVYSKAKSIYGETLPSIVEKRIEKELNSIIGYGYDTIYLISQKLVQKSLEDGYLVGSRGSVGSSLVATFLDITEVNPLAPHYICDNCTYSEFYTDGSYASGFDLPAQNCPNCGKVLKGEGHDIPFEVFLGFKGDKVPDIDLNFSGEYQSKAHDYTKVLFGEDKVFRAGTISTIAQKTAYGYVKGYEEKSGKYLNAAETNYLTKGCQGVKRGTGQHPGGIIVIPDELDVYDFTPIQYPADDTSSSWFTTHFDFHAIHDNVLKLDILGHDDPTIIHGLEELSEINCRNLNFMKPEVIEIFRTARPLGIEPVTFKRFDNSDYTIFTTGTLGVPEFGTRFVIEMLKDTQPKSFAELVKISGLSHGTDVWLNNGQYLIQNQLCAFKDVIGCRDDIMVQLSHKGLEESIAFKIMEDVRKGKGLTEEYIQIMRDNDVEDWYIDSCNKIKYMFPKAHATAYVLMAMRIAYFKVFNPIYFYATYFSTRVDDFDIDVMIQGKEAVNEKIAELLMRPDLTSKEKAVLNTLEISLEMLTRGFTFANIDIDKSDASKFIVENRTLIPPFRSIDGLGSNVAKQMIEAREERPFISIEDLRKRGKINKTVLAKLEILNVVEHLPEGDQLTLF